MKVAIIGATGFVGAPILAEALTHTDLTITAIVRNVSALSGHERLTGKSCDIHDLPALAGALAWHDAVIHAFHGHRGAADVHNQNVDGHKAIIAAVKKAGVSRLLAVGGAASLKTPDGVELIESSRWNPEFDPYKDAILGTRALYYLLKEETALDWAFLAPSEWLRPGERTGVFRYGKDDLLIDENGDSRISLEDYALAMVEELRHPKHHRERFTVGY